MDVAIAACRDYSPEEVRRALGEVLAPFGGLSWVTPGMRVAIKANLVSAKRPEAAVTTHPALLCALSEMLTARGASVVIGDSPGGLYNAAYVGRIYTARASTTTSGRRPPASPTPSRRASSSTRRTSTRVTPSSTSASSKRTA